MGIRGPSTPSIEVAQVLEIVGGDRVGPLGAAQQRLDHPARPLLAELVGELVQVRFPAENQLLASVVDRVAGNRPAAVPSCPVLEAGFVGQRVDQPWLARGAGLARERLARLSCVLGEQGLGAHVAHPAKDDALRKPVRALRVAGPELAQDRDEGVADECVDLVDHEHERTKLGAPDRVISTIRRPRPPGRDAAGDAAIPIVRTVRSSLLYPHFSVATNTWSTARAPCASAAVAARDSSTPDSSQPTERVYGHLQLDHSPARIGK